MTKYEYYTRDNDKIILSSSSKIHFQLEIYIEYYSKTE